MVNLRKHWARIVAFVAIVVAASAGFVVVQDQNSQTRDAVEQVRALTKRIDKEDTGLRAARSAQIKALHNVDVRDCGRFHKLVGVLEALAKERISQVDETPNPGTTPALRDAFDRTKVDHLVSLREYVAKLMTGDCSSVPPLPPLVSGK